MWMSITPSCLIAASLRVRMSSCWYGRRGHSNPLAVPPSPQCSSSGSHYRFLYLWRETESQRSHSLWLSSLSSFLINTARATQSCRTTTITYSTDSSLPSPHQNTKLVIYAWLKFLLWSCTFFPFLFLKISVTRVKLNSVLKEGAFDPVFF